MLVAAQSSPELWTADQLVAQALDELPGSDRVRVSARSDLPPVRVDAVPIQRALVNPPAARAPRSPAG